MWVVKFTIHACILISVDKFSVVHYFLSVILQCIKQMYKTEDLLTIITL